MHADTRVHTVYTVGTPRQQSRGVIYVTGKRDSLLSVYKEWLTL